MERPNNILPTKDMVIKIGFEYSSFKGLIEAILYYDERDSSGEPTGAIMVAEPIELKFRRVGETENVPNASMVFDRKQFISAIEDMNTFGLRYGMIDPIKEQKSISENVVAVQKEMINSLETELQNKNDLIEKLVGIIENSNINISDITKGILMERSDA